MTKEQPFWGTFELDKETRNPGALPRAGGVSAAGGGYGVRGQIRTAETLSEEDSRND